jgi:hypothetical protein
LGEGAHQPRIVAPLRAPLGDQHRPDPADQRLADRRRDQQGHPVGDAVEDAGEVEVPLVAGTPGDERADADADEPVDRVPDRASLGQPGDGDQHRHPDRGDHGGPQVAHDVGEHEDQHGDAGLDQAPPAAELVGHLLGEAGQLPVVLRVRRGGRLLSRRHFGDSSS